MQKEYNETLSDVFSKIFIKIYSNKNQYIRRFTNVSKNTATL